MRSFPDALVSSVAAAGRRVASSGATAIACIALVAATPAVAAPVLYAIGPDANGVGRVFQAIAAGAAGTALGSGDVAFNGGLAYRPSSSLFYGIANDAFGQSTLVGFSGAAPNTFVSTSALGVGFLGGLAVDTTHDRLYAIGSDANGLSSLYAVGPGAAAVDLGVLGYGFFGGLTFDPLDGSLIAIAGDTFGVQRRVESIDVSGATPVATMLFDLGDGSIAYSGGIAFDPTTSLFDVLGSDFTGLSSLYAFGSGPTTLVALASSIGTGFINVGLALAPDQGGGGGGGGGTVPEPAPWTLTLFAASWLAIRRRDRHQPSRLPLERS